MVKKYFFIFLIVISSLVLYLKTLLPGHEFHDIGELQTAACTLGIAHPPGYPTYIILGKIFTLIPISNPAWRVNFMSAFFSICSLILFFKITKKVFRSGPAAFFAALILAFSQNFWYYSLVAEMYSLNVFFMNLFVYLVINKFPNQVRKLNLKLYYFFFFLLGLAQGNHRNITIITPLLVLYLILLKLKVFINLKNVLKFCLLFILGLGIYLFLPLRSLQNPYLNYAKPITWKNFKYLVTAEQFRFLMFTVPLKRLVSERVEMFLAFVKEQFLLPGILLVLLGLGFLLYKKKFKVAALFLLIFLLNTFVWLSYNTNDVYRYLTPSYVILAFFIGGGISIFFTLVKKVKKNLLQLLLNLLISIPLLYFVFFLIKANYKKVDQSQNNGAYAWGMEVLKSLKPNAVIISHWGYSPALWYLQGCEGVRPDIIIADDRVRVDENWGSAAETVKLFINTRPVYIIYAENYIDDVQQAGYGLIKLKNVIEVIEAPRPNRPRIQSMIYQLFSDYKKLKSCRSENHLTFGPRYPAVPIKSGRIFAKAD
ncbi:hypothetical protein A3J78_02095 [Candidatus Beckwithbacteria bacterium RBG_13_35_6]|uniref:Glycosyltransferase RgtA/B/C/D-like domain-containing protein n=1 Tax=Candidatus Beckwithbacteria bacterium RBG_13_35_6 TaxID=1797456 RepID=A0A1F5DET9_9BACT|nr:MAG: hypothetical protein A3J78_02095 [Candidatus Beckwithbacteria bacterium RBG_13_35_6]